MPLPPVLSFSLRTAAFPASGHPDVAVHVPPGFDASRAPGIVLYFHGWNGCVGAALADGDTPCTDEGDPHPGAALATQMDQARVNALLIALELRVDAPTGEPGDLAAPGAARAMLREILSERLVEAVGCPIELEAVDRIVVVAHSGGYQAAASVLEFGDVPVFEVALLDGLYGAEDVFREWLTAGHHFVDVYTCCGGTLARSRALAADARARAFDFLPAGGVYDDDGDSELDPGALVHAVVFKRVPSPHGVLAREYVRGIVEGAGFADPAPGAGVRGDATDVKLFQEILPNRATGAR
jgi:hypothetical protein